MADSTIPIPRDLPENPKQLYITKCSSGGNFSYTDKPGLDNSRYESNAIPFKDGVFQLPDSVKAAAVLFAKDMRQMCSADGIGKLEETQELHDATLLKGGTADERMAALLVAKSMGNPRIDSKDGKPVVFFDNKLREDDLTGYGSGGQPQDRVLTIAIAQEILHDTYKVGPAINNADLVNEMSKVAKRPALLR